MALDFQQVLEQVKALGEYAPVRARHLQELHQQAWDLLLQHANDQEALRQKVKRITQNYDPNLRCALPVVEPGRALEPLDGHFPLPNLPEKATIIAADGSQVAPDRHAAVNYCLINVGAIQMSLASSEPPQETVNSQLFYDEALYTESGVITDARLALMRDLKERTRLAELAAKASPPAVTFTDGPMELWGAKDPGSAEGFQKSLDEYLGVLSDLYTLKVTTAGYVDKPAANLVVRLLEMALLTEDQLPNTRKSYPLRGIIDIDLYRQILEPGERSAVFAIQSRSAQQYRDALSLHFFYLNVGRLRRPWLARVEIPGWVATDTTMLDHLHAILIQQCRVMGPRPYPYLLHRAHETALVTLQEKEQVSQMIAQELRKRGIEVSGISYKQSAKNLAGRSSYER
jgi:hypothetical protein